MAYTEANLADIEAAILALATGTRKVRLTWGDKSLEYGQTDLKALRALKSEVEAALVAADSARALPNYILSTTSKGL
jgi:hypothetical protein